MVFKLASFRSQWAKLDRPAAQRMTASTGLASCVLPQVAPVARRASVTPPTTLPQQHRPFRAVSWDQKKGKTDGQAGKQTENVVSQRFDFRHMQHAHINTR